MILGLTIALAGVPENPVDQSSDRIVLWSSDPGTPRRIDRRGPWITAVKTAQVGVAGLSVAFVVPLALGWRRDPWSRTVRKVAAHPIGAIALPTAIGLTVAGLHGVIATPTPTTPDEYSNLLLADTLLHGRTANPTTDLWRHFETIAVLLQPTYASKYPPAHGAMLAIGQGVFGHPWFGVWLEIGFAILAVTLMLRRWLGPRWAVVGATLVALHPNIQSFEHYFHGLVNYSWSHGYFGGALAFGAGALLLGAIGRRDTPVRWVIAFAVGLGLLAHTRPLEGLLVAIPASLMLLRQLIHTEQLGRSLVPGVACLAPALIAIPLYNATITGSATKFPHRLYADEYSAAAMFIVQEPKPFPNYHNRAIRSFYKRYQRKVFEDARAHPFHTRAIEVSRIVTYYAWPGLVGFAGILVVRRRRLLVPVAMVGLATGSGLLMMTWHPHYFAPAAAALFLLNTAGLEPLTRQAPRFLGAALVLGLFMLPLTLEPSVGHRWPEKRRVLEQELLARGGKHLVLVDSVLPFKRWVQNGADLEGAPIVWARSRRYDERLMAHYADRTIWLLEGDVPRPVAQQLSVPNLLAR